MSVRASGMPGPPSKGLFGCCFADPSPPQVTPRWKGMWGCAQPCAGHPGGVPSLHTGDAEHGSCVGSGKWKEEARKVLSSPPSFFFSLFTPFFLFFSSPHPVLDVAGGHGLSHPVGWISRGRECVGWPASPRSPWWWGRPGRDIKGAVAAPAVPISCGARSRPRGAGPPTPPRTSISPG